MSVHLTESETASESSRPPPRRPPRRVKLGWLITAVFVGCGVLVASLVPLVSAQLRRVAVQDLADGHGRQVSRLAFETVLAVMERGGSGHDVDRAMARVNLVDGGLSASLYPGERVAKQYGSVLGVQPQPPSELVQRALEGRGEQVLVQGDTIRYVYPLTFAAECLTCHTDGAVGEVAGAVEVLHPVGDVTVPLRLVLELLFLFTGTLLVAGLVALRLSLRALVTAPIAGLIALMRRILRDNDYARRVTNGSRIAEIGALSESFDHLLASVQHYNRQLQELGGIDPLTSLPNRGRFATLVCAELARANAAGAPCCIAVIDLDHFKHVNDAFGHPVGDVALRQITAVLRRSLREGDRAARTGGDEFGVLLPNTPLDEGLQLMKRLCAAIAREAIPAAHQVAHVSASIGLACHALHGTTEEELSVAADVAMHKAKNDGRNRVATVEPGEVASAAETFGRAVEVHRAIREDRLQIHLQPIIDVKTGQPYGYEVLTRVREGERVVSAGRFVGALEKLGRTGDFDRYVLRRALELRRASPEYSGRKLFVNLSAATLEDTEFMSQIPALIESHGVPLGELVFEVTEREALRHVAGLASVMRELNELGIEFALDDFGSGFSSFLYLKYFPVQYVKIEGSFGRTMGSDPRDRLMVEHIHAVSRSLGLMTIAEWVEDEAAHDAAVDIGIQLAQGYHYARPTEWITTDAKQSA